jgi:hypothetical protein
LYIGEIPAGNRIKPSSDYSTSKFEKVWEIGFTPMFTGKK